MAAKKAFRPSAKTSSPTPPRPKSQRTEPPAPLDPFFQPGFWSAHLFPVLILTALAFILYGITVGYGYLQDDQLVIWDNIYVQKGFAGLREIFSYDSLLGYYKDPKLLIEGGRYRPLPLATYAIETGIFGKDHPGISHFFNVLLYGATGIVLYRLLLALFPVKEGSQWYFTLPFLSAVLFMLHPLHSEVVANIKGRDEILSLLGSLGALYALMKHFDTDKNSWLGVAGLSFFLGLLSKENTATFLAVIPLTFWMFSKVPSGRIVGTTAVLLGATLLFLIIRYQALGYMVNNGKAMNELAINPFFGMSGGEKFATIFLALGWYLKLLVVPHPLTIDYYPYHVPRVNWADWRPLLSLLLYAVMGVWALRQFNKSRAATLQTGPDLRIPAWGILYYFLTVSVVSNIFVDTSTFMNERYLYMPSVGFCVALAWLLVRKLPDWLDRPLGAPTMPGVAIAGAIALLFGWRVLTRVPDWSGDGRALVETAIRVGPNSYRANYYYGAMLYTERYQKLNADSKDPQIIAARKASIDSVDLYISRSLEINPTYRPAGNLKVSVAAARFRDDANLEKLLKDFEFLVKKQSYNGDMLVNALEVLKSLKGSDPNLYNFFCHRIGYEFYFKQKRDANGAVEFLNLALANYPYDIVVMQDLVEVYTALGDRQKAAEMQQRAQTTTPPPPQ